MTKKKESENKRSESEDTPEDILAALKADESALDEAVHEDLSKEASGINNDGTEAQVRHLRKSGWEWNTIREAIGLEPRKE